MENGWYVGGCVHEEGLAIGFLRVKGERNGNKHGGDRGDASLCRVAANEGIRALANGVRERGHGALRVRRMKRQDEEKEEADRLDSHFRLHGTPDR